MFWIKQKNVRDNITAAVKNFIYHSNIGVTHASIEEALRQHPGYPGMQAIKDALEGWQVACGIYQIGVADLPEIIFPAIAYLRKDGGSYVVLTGVASGQVAYIDPEEGPKQEPLHVFGRRWNGIVLLAEATAQSGEPAYARRAWAEKYVPDNDHLVFLFSLLLLSLLLYGEIAFVKTFLVQWLALTILVYTSLVIHCFLFVMSHHPSSRFIRAMGPLYAWYTAQNVQHRNRTIRLGRFARINPVDAGLVYSAGRFASLLFSVCMGKQHAYAILFSGVNLLVLLVITYPIIRQAVTPGRHSTIHLMLAGALCAETVLLLGLLPAGTGALPGTASVLAFAAGFVVATGGLLVVKPLLSQAHCHAELKKELALFRSLPNALTMLLAHGEPVKLGPMENEIAVGCRNGSTSVVLILHPFDRESGNLVEQLSTMIEGREHPVRVVLRFADAHRSALVAEVVSYFTACHQAGNPQKTLALLKHWYGLPTKQLRCLKQEYRLPPEVKPEPFLETVRQQSRWIEQNRIRRVPSACINDKVLPAGVTLESLFFLLNRQAPPD